MSCCCARTIRADLRRSLATRRAFRRLLPRLAQPINGVPPANRTGVLDIKAAAAGRPAPAGGLSKAPRRRGQVVLRRPSNAQLHSRRSIRRPLAAGRVSVDGNIDIRCFFARQSSSLRRALHATATAARGIDTQAMRLLAAARGRLRTLRLAPSHAPVTPHSSRKSVQNCLGRQSVLGWRGMPRSRGGRSWRSPSAAPSRRCPSSSSSSFGSCSWRRRRVFVVGGSRCRRRCAS